MSEVVSFNLVKILFPSFEGIFLKDPGTSPNFNQGYRINLSILSDNRVQIVFGIRLESQQKDNNDNLPLVICAVDALAEVEFTTTLPAQISDLSQIPLLPNILAMLFPFMREKVNYFFSNNMLMLMLPPINTFEVIKDIRSPEGSLFIQDRRK